jgi:hypothetical protein
MGSSQAIRKWFAIDWRQSCQTAAIRFRRDLVPLHPRPIDPAGTGFLAVFQQRRLVTGAEVSSIGSPGHLLPPGPGIPGPGGYSDLNRSACELGPPGRERGYCAGRRTSPSHSGRDGSCIPTLLERPLATNSFRVTCPGVHNPPEFTRCGVLRGPAVPQGAAPSLAG